MGALRPRGTGVAQDVGRVVVGERAEGVLGRSYRALSVGIVSVVLLIAFEAMAVGTAMPVAARELDGVSAYGFVFSAYFTTSLFGMVLSGQWSDLRGPLGPLTTGIAAFAAGLLLSGTAGAMWLFIVGRAVQGLGGGLVIVALYVVVGRAYPERLRPSIMAGFAASWIIPSVVGPLAAGAVTEQLGWRWVFVGIPVLVVLPLGLALPQIRRRASGPVGGPAPGPGAPADIPAGTPVDIQAGAPSVSSPSTASPSTDGASSGAHPAASPPSPASAPAPGAASAPAGVSAPSSASASPSPSPSFDRRRIRLALGISVGAGLLQYAAQDLRWLSVVPAAVGVALLVPAVLGLLPRGTYRAVRGLPSVVLLRGVAAGSFIAAESFVPLMLVTQRGLSPTLAGFSLAAGGGAWALGSWVQARARVEPYRERLMTTGMVVVAAAIVTVPSVLIETVPVWTVAVAWAFGCFGMGLVISSTSVLLLKLSAPEEAGTNSAALQISDGLSNALLLAAGGAAFAALGGGAAGHTATTASGSGSHPAAFIAVFLPMAAVALLGAWVTTRLRER
ncbi:MFS transporter [Streptomyces neyagawaensis]|uniref:MFS transporter n=1 Tax=Streptomyces neyagawaensis TaxID=42238 RepID=UPI00201CDBD6|nr:MFS transporter [Streptomyces neyagawaensis]MCL6736801.1 MFS transporter [Streptomyces neyagawaensis]MDE1684569.1 MFS transporter [Streptomyces neyagawaensis]